MDGQTRINVRLLLRIDREIPATDLKPEHILNLRKYIEAGQAILPDHIDELFSGRRHLLITEEAWNDMKVALGSVPPTCSTFQEACMKPLKKAFTDVVQYFRWGMLIMGQQNPALETDTALMPRYVRAIKENAYKFSERWKDLRRALQAFSKEIKRAEVHSLIGPRLDNKANKYPLRIWSQEHGHALEAIYIIQDALQSLVDHAEEITAACNFIVEHMTDDRGRTDNVVQYALEAWGKMNTLAKIAVAGFAN